MRTLFTVRRSSGIWCCESTITWLRQRAADLSPPRRSQSPPTEFRCRKTSCQNGLGRLVFCNSGHFQRIILHTLQRKSNQVCHINSAALNVQPNQRSTQNALRRMQGKNKDNGSVKCSGLHDMRRVPTLVAPRSAYCHLWWSFKHLSFQPLRRLRQQWSRTTGTNTNTVNHPQLTPDLHTMWRT